jgi:orotidine-5'-phosphate decarboxylase
MTFQQKLDSISAKNNSLVCIGLDSDISKLPPHLMLQKYPQFAFNKAIIDETDTLVCAYKPNSAFYEARGTAGITELKMTFDYIRDKYPQVVIILDAKRADIGNTNEGYAGFAFDYLGADAITLHPYLGKEALKPFLDRKEKGSIILCRTSNPGAGEFQDLTVGRSQSSEASAKDVRPLYQIVAEKVSGDWNYNGNCALVVGATYPGELTIVRRLVGDMPLLIPGIGAQGGDIGKTVQAGLDSKKAGAMINSSRGIIFASGDKDFARKARVETQKLKDEINKYRMPA